MSTEDGENVWQNWSAYSEAEANKFINKILDTVLNNTVRNNPHTVPSNYCGENAQKPCHLHFSCYEP